MKLLAKFLNIAILVLILFTGCRKDDEFVTPIVQPQDIVILYDNDPHCAIEGYAKMAWLKRSLLQQTENVCVVSCGDFVQGDSYGLLSQGESPITLMNAVGYDFVTLGNHEFDYSVTRLNELVKMLDAQVLCCNFVRTSDGKPVYTASAVKDFGGTQIAFIGVATPQSFTTSTPAFFMDDQGATHYSFCESTLPQLVQHEVDSVRKAGVKYVVVLSHLGDAEGSFISSQQLIAATTGIDIVLDGHSHSVIPCDSVRNKEGRFVKRTSTGTAFENIGKVTITPLGAVNVELIPAEEISEDLTVARAASKIKLWLQSFLSQPIGQSQVELTITDAEGNRIVRNREANIGDFSADAFRDYFGADIGWVNGGGLRTNLNAGTVTFGDLLAVSPFGNQALYGEITGQVLLDNLEMSYRKCPAENGGFAQLAGVRCEIDTATSSSVIVDGNGMFLSVGSTRRVKNVQVLNRATGQYEPIDPEGRYTIAGAIYVLQNHGDGQDFGSIRLISDRPVLTDAEIMSRYITETLSGTIGDTYSAPQGRIALR